MSSWGSSENVLRGGFDLSLEGGLRTVQIERQVERHLGSKSSLKCLKGFGFLCFCFFFLSLEIFIIHTTF